MKELLETILNIYGSMFIGALLIEYGISRWQNRKFNRKSLWTVFVIVVGVHFALKHIT